MAKYTVVLHKTISTVGPVPWDGQTLGCMADPDGFCIYCGDPVEEQHD